MGRLEAETPALYLPERLYDRLVELGRPTQKSILVVHVPTQTLTLFAKGKPVTAYRISTSEYGLGATEGSYQTPPGLHRVAEKIGQGASRGAVFRARKTTGEVWRASNETDEDLICTRILWLEGLEPGVNRGRGAGGVLVDSKERYIYIHGTNHEKSLGSPTSRGCIRMSSKDILDLFSRVEVGTIVWVCDRW